MIIVTLYTLSMKPATCSIAMAYAVINTIIIGRFVSAHITVKNIGA